MIERWENHIAVVTGAGTQIGQAIVKYLLNAKLKVVAIEKRLERIENLKLELPKNLQDKLYPIKCDVSDQFDVKKNFDWIEKNLGGVHVLINNAGIVINGCVDFNMKTDVMSIMHCTKEAFKSMKTHKFNGYVFLINTLAADHLINIPNRSYNVYAPSKYAVTELTKIYRQEFRNMGTNVQITVVTPSAGRTTLITDSCTKLIEKEEQQRANDIADAVVMALATPEYIKVDEIFVKPPKMEN
ncbi:farnesol dehydrogenase-like [Condylostylus longicornis]|uniref:farnesol dehydrogenase-like n=1 Tax=Condylostylus longicornis TaxID=2530218 RepID=UPI00244D9CDF|nr:farnesol dehydrogenase-like [Condylostylus longicornis]